MFGAGHRALRITGLVWVLLWVFAGAGLARTGVAVPLSAASSLQPNHGSQGYLGIDVRDVDQEQVTGLRLKDARGAVVVRVDHDGPAGKMGLREHDVVLQMNGTAIDGEEQMRRLLHEMGPGRSVTLVVSRDGQAMTLSTQMAVREEVERQAWLDHLGGPQAPAIGFPTGQDASGDAPAAAGGPVSGGRYGRSFLGSLMMSPTYTGAVLEKMKPQLAGFFGVQGGAGLLVQSVESNSPAALAGMRAGDVVVRANARGVESVSQWVKQVKDAKGRPITVVVMREKAEKTLTITPDVKRRAGLDAGADPRVMACLTEL